MSTHQTLHFRVELEGFLRFNRLVEQLGRAIATVFADHHAKIVGALEHLAETDPVAVILEELTDTVELHKPTVTYIRPSRASLRRTSYHIKPTFHPKYRQAR